MANVVIIDFACLGIAEWDPWLDMRISYWPVMGLRRTMRRAQGVTYRPRQLFKVSSSSVTGDVCLTYRIFVLIIFQACLTVLSPCILIIVR